MNYPSYVTVFTPILTYFFFTPPKFPRLISVILIFCYSVSVCSKPLGIQNGRLKNSKITASSEWNHKHAAWLGRLGRTNRRGYAGAWCAKQNNHYQWIKFDFSRPMRITKVATQGRYDYDQWVTRYTMSSSVDGTHWATYRVKSQDKV